MAMMYCPNCGQPVSDKAVTCVHCGFVLKEPEKKVCPECGQELEDGVTVCPNCGCPIDESTGTKPEENVQGAAQASPQPVEVTGVRVNKKRAKLVAIIVVIIAAALVAGGFAYSYVQKKNAEKAAEEYSQNLSSLALQMVTSAASAEDCGNQIKQVWGNAIFKERDASTDEFTRPDGFFVDFNEALQNLFADSGYQSKISGIESDEDSISIQMKSMKEPPEKYEDAYKALKETYSAYTTFVDYIQNPTGSYESFGSNFSTYDSNLLTAYNNLKLYIE